MEDYRRSGSLAADSSDSLGGRLGNRCPARAGFRIVLDARG